MALVSHVSAPIPEFFMVKILGGNVLLGSLVGNIAVDY
jgi:hypothetical protein